MFKYELHLHSKDCSACAISDFKEMLDAAAEHGYSGVVFTNHFLRGNTSIDRKLPWKEFVKPYAESYYSAKAYGERLGLTVFFGIEEGYGNGKEVLIYGITPELIADNPEFKEWNIKEKVDFVRKNGGITVCPHPFRKAPYIPDPDSPPDTSLFDAIEGCNYCNTPQENIKAVEFAKRNNMVCTAGGDIHNALNFGHSGISVETKIETAEQLVKVIKSGNFKCINSPEDTLKK